MKTRNKWYKLENAAKMFPPTSSNEDPKVFRFFVELNENVEPVCLQKATNETLEEFPLFKSVLKRGLFWYYLEYSNRNINIEIENTNPCDKIENNYLCRISYYKKRINIEVNHVLTDGTGTLEFIKLLTANYLIFRHKLTKEIYIDKNSIEEREKDSFNKYYKKNKNIRAIKDPNAFQIKGKKYNEGILKITELIMNPSEVIEIAKKYNTTITVYLTAIMLDSIASTMTEREKKKPIIITIPVNLRNFFPSKTARNFFNVISVIYYANEENKLEDIINNVDNQFKEKITKHELTRRMNSLAYLENLLILRLIPIFIKDVVLKHTYKYTRKKRTTTISNMGIISMPKELEKYINLFGVYSSSENIHTCICTFRDKLVFSFASHFLNHEIQRNFVKNLTNENIKVILNTNNIEEDEYDKDLF